MCVCTREWFLKNNIIAMIISCIGKWRKTRVSHTQTRTRVKYVELHRLLWNCEKKWHKTTSSQWIIREKVAILFHFIRKWLALVDDLMGFFRLSIDNAGYIYSPTKQYRMLDSGHTVWAENHFQIEYHKSKFNNFYLHDVLSGLEHVTSCASMHKWTIQWIYKCSNENLLRNILFSSNNWNQF